MAPSTVPKNRQLPSKENSLFKEVLTLYETRQLKKGLKTADAILKRCPDHGETLCMKGLITVHLGRRDEGIELVKKGMRLDLTSHIVWHVFGLIQKGEKKYDEALKSYTQALKCDPDNQNILRDAANLQAQLRIYDGLVESRQKLLRMRPTLRSNWVALAVAYQLNGQLEDAKKILEGYQSTLKNIPDYDVELSEVLLYHVQILERLGELQEALILLDTNAKDRRIVDRTAVMVARARILSAMGKEEEAEAAWQALIERNADNVTYYQGYFKAKGIDLDSLTDQNRSRTLTLLGEFSSQMPRSTVPRRLALLAASTSEFPALARTYLTSALEKGVPSLFTDVKSLYSDTAKRDEIETIVEDFRATLDPSTSSDSNSMPTTYLWTLYFLAQHHTTLGRQPRALELIQTALAHTLTLPELYTCHARILRRAGDPYGAARSTERARLLDGQDRFLNTKCAKYRMRIGLVQEASEILGMFTKKDAASPGSDLEDMQSLLYLVEVANGYEHDGNLSMALKKYVTIQKIFDEMYDDQFDFHSYSPRKFNLNVYMDMMEWEDNLRTNSGYVAAALGAARIWIRAHDDPDVIKNASTTSVSMTNEEKKAKNKAKKAAAKAQEQPMKTGSQPASNEDKGLEPPTAKDEDLDGRKLLSATDGLDRAAQMLAPLVARQVKNIDVWIAVFDVSVRRKKFIQALKALKHAHAIDPTHPELHVRVVQLKHTLTKESDSIPEPLQPVIKTGMAELVPDEVSLEAFNSQYMQSHSTSASAIVAAAKAMAVLQASNEAVDDTMFTVFNPDLGLTVKTASLALTFLRDSGSSRAEEFRERCQKTFELSTIFGTAEELSAAKKTAMIVDDEPQTESAEAEVLP